MLDENYVMPRIIIKRFQNLFINVFAIATEPNGYSVLMNFITERDRITNSRRKVSSLLVLNSVKY